ncbi:hypothetical protein M758_5G124600 [Ceratodon purpureus]|nr:hypothetical protein M758_5G124600 [Ceratodon purpureus]
MAEVDGSSGASLVFAYYVTGHGLGHATRVVEVARHLCLAGHEVHIVTAAPEFVFKRDIPSPKLHIRKVLLDCGAVQSDALTVDCQGSLEEYARTAVVNRAALLAVEAEWLKSIKANLVVADIVPVACTAANLAGIPSVCVTNFSWDFIYSEYVTVAGKHHQSIVWQIAEDYSHALFLIRLPGYCPMPAFRDAVDVPLVVRDVRRSRKQVRKDLGVSEDVKLLLFNFGGQDARWSLKDEYLPPGWLCWVCGAPAEQQLGSNFKRMDRDAYVPDLIAASDCMVGKIGYGTVSETLACKTPLVFVRRDHFNEEPFLRKMLEFYRGGVEMNRRDFMSGRWAPYLERALIIRPCFNGSLNGGKVAASLLEDAARGKADTIKPHNGAQRLRDAIVFGFQLQRHPGRELTIPDWYGPTETKLGLLPARKSIDGIQGAVLPYELEVDDFEILEGNLHGLEDTAEFLRTLARLDEEGDVRASDLAEKPQQRERLAAGGLFRWEDDLFIARAPGRLDVMGGIADYSGSLVLQMPIKEACHVAVQRSPPTLQRLWKHTRARLSAHGGAAKPVVCIVSFGSDMVNRAPTFDMDLSDFLDSNGDPISYEAARQYFKQDTSQKWAAYVAGTLLVLMRELGVRFLDSISILVSSDVPEGKGVSSSAALEVATMSAIAAAYGLKISPRDLAILCQKVENHVVGAPCGVMDQMASACGEANKLLAMVCQPAEVKGHVNIPLHVQFWGIDSGIRHSVGGADYGSVRVGAFMGRRIIQCISSKQCEGLKALAAEDVDDPEFALSLVDAKEQYLCNIPPHRLEGEYADELPAKMKGQEFLNSFGSHNDPVTRIDPNQSYAIKAPTAHPVYEDFRVKSFAVALTAAESDEQLTALGELMLQSHYSYSKCGLGSHGTDRLVRLVKSTNQKAQSDGATLFGAKITGGGCGGTVCVLGRAGARSSDQILKIQESYKAATGHLPYIFEGSSMGAGQFGFLRVHRRASHEVPQLRAV